MIVTTKLVKQLLIESYFNEFGNDVISYFDIARVVYKITEGCDFDSIGEILNWQDVLNQIIIDYRAFMIKGLEKIVEDRLRKLDPNHPLLKEGDKND